jgi:hypothetical protein
MLSDDACKVIERQSEEYMWKDMNGLNEEMDGMTITAFILWRLRPHNKWICIPKLVQSRR